MGPVSLNCSQSNLIQLCPSIFICRVNTDSILIYKLFFLYYFMLRVSETVQDASSLTSGQSYNELWYLAKRFPNLECHENSMKWITDISKKKRRLRMEFLNREKLDKEGGGWKLKKKSSSVQYRRHSAYSETQTWDSSQNNLLL